MHTFHLQQNACLENNLHGSAASKQIVVSTCCILIKREVTVEGILIDQTELQLIRLEKSRFQNFSINDTPQGETWKCVIRKTFPQNSSAFQMKSLPKFGPLQQNFFLLGSFINLEVYQNSAFTEEIFFLKNSYFIDENSSDRKQL